MISNQKASARALMTFSGVWVGLVIIFALSFLELFPSPVWMRIALACIIGLAALFFYLGGYHYLQLEVKDNKELMVRYYNLFPVGRKFRAFKIPLQQFHHYELKNGAGGATTWLTLFQKMKGGVAKYPPVGFSAIDRATRKEIIDFLSALERRN